jgi:hypothetical protein
MRFCSRCGFTLNGIALVLENNGIIPQVVPEPHQIVRPSRNRIMTESALLTAFCWAVAFAATFWFSAHGSGEVIAEMTSLLFFVLGLIGLIRFLYGFLFAKDVGKTASTFAHNQVPSGEKHRGALPPQQSIPISDYPLRVNTKEMAPRMSVTENTTRLLDDQPPSNE